MRTAAIKRVGLGLVAALGLAGGALAADQQAPAGCRGMGPGMMQGQGPMGPGMMQGQGPTGPGMMQGQGPMGQGMMQGQGPMGPGMMQGQGPMGPGMMQGQGPTGPGMMQGQGPTGPGMMQGQGPMGPGMMQGQGPMGPGMMGSDMEAMWARHHAMGAHEGHGPGPGGGLLGLEGRRVVPMIRLSADDVRLWLEAYLEEIGNPRLKVGAIEEVDDGTLRAEIVTVDDSLVERLTVDRHTGRITSGS